MRQGKVWNKSTMLPEPKGLNNNAAKVRECNLMF